MHEKELYACVFAFHRYRIYLEGRTDTQLYTDNMALTFLKANKYEDSSGRLIRWFQYLDRFQYKMNFRKGVDNADADMMTRAYEDDPGITEDPSANWIYVALHRHTSKITSEETKVVELRFPGPSIKKGALPKVTTEVQPKDVVEASASWDDNTFVVGVPPLRTAQMRTVLNALTACGSWAIWAPIALLQETYFAEREIQVIVVKGGRSYGGHYQSNKVVIMVKNHRIMVRECP